MQENKINFMRHCPLIVALLLVLSCHSNKADKKIESYNLDTLKKMADSSYEKNEYQRSILFYSKLIELDSMNGEYYYKRGNAYAMILIADSAIWNFNKSAILNYRMGDSYFSIGLNYSAINDSLAIVYLKKSLQLNPNDKEAEKILKECHDRLLKLGNKLL